jgi:hypothetical protein
MFGFGLEGEQIGTIPSINHSCSDARRRNRRPRLCGGPDDRAPANYFGEREEANKYSESNIALEFQIVFGEFAVHPSASESR